MVICLLLNVVVSAFKVGFSNGLQHPLIVSNCHNGGSFYRLPNLPMTDN